VRLLTAAVLIAATGLATAAQIPAACMYSDAPLNLRPSDPIKDFSGVLPIADYLDEVVACNTLVQFPSPLIQQPTAQTSPSRWLQSERELYGQVLAKHPVDVLVVPLQIQGYGLDRIERQIMAAEIVQAIDASGRLTAADPWLVSRALGEGMRRIDFLDVDHLSAKVGAKTVVLGYVGHDTHHAFTLTLQVFERSTEGVDHGLHKKWQQDWRSVPFSDEETPAFKMRKMLPEIMRLVPLGLNTEQSPATSGPKRTATSKIALTPRELVTAAGRSVPPLQAFDLLGAMAQSSPELSREREFERAILAAFESAGAT